MLIAHIPAGYLATRGLLRRFAMPEASRIRIMLLGVAASVLPDLDLLWWHFVDHRRQVHHAYLTHIPLAWMIVFAAGALVLTLIRARRDVWIAGAAVAANVMIHLILDTTAGGIRWAWPFSQHEFALSHPPAAHDAWIYNFVLHWTFGLEILITIVALAVWWMSRSTRAVEAAPG